MDVRSCIGVPSFDPAIVTRGAGENKSLRQLPFEAAVVDVDYVSRRRKIRAPTIPREKRHE
jgi:hypothetical protein